MNETWQVFPDFSPRLVAAHIQDNVMGGLIENTATAPGPGGSVAAGGKIQWLSTAFYTFDPDTLKVVREVYYADESVIEQKINAAQA
jgi:hypothetical protein